MQKYRLKGDQADGLRKAMFQKNHPWLYRWFGWLIYRGLTMVRCGYCNAKCYPTPDHPGFCSLRCQALKEKGE